MSGPRALLPLAALLAVAALALGGPLALAVAPARAAEEHAFDPVLSLRGGCETEELDRVPDPGPCPGTPGVDHPEEPFKEPCGVAVDPHGDIYVASPEVGLGGGTEGRIDVFDSQGRYLTEIEDEHQPCDLAVDSEGNLYVAELNPRAVSMYEATSYPPASGADYGSRSVVTEQVGCGGPQDVAIDPSNDHLYVAGPCYITEYNSAANGLLPISGEEEIGQGLGERFHRVAVCGTNHDVYANGTITGLNQNEAGEPKNTRSFVFDGTNGQKKVEVDGQGVPDGTPEGGFGFNEGGGAIAVDQANCDFYVGDITHRGVIYQFGADGHYIGQLRHSFSDPGPPYFAALAVDDPYPGQSDYTSPNEGEVYVAQGHNPPSSHLYAFRPGGIGPPEIQAMTADGITETEAVLGAELNPGGLDTRYSFQYISEADYLADGEQFGPGTNSVPTPEADAVAETSFLPVFAAIGGLAPGTDYRFRLLASNCEDPEAIPGDCEAQGEVASFATYASESGLPDGRAYELVSPPDTNGLIPTMAPLGENVTLRGNFDTLLASPDGQSVLFGAEGGSLPALGGGGFHDVYEASRTSSGWQSRFAGLDGTQVEEPNYGGVSSDHGYSFWVVDQEGRGSLQKGNYLRLPDGSVQPIGIGSLGLDRTAGGDWISSGAGHVIFHTGQGLNPQTIQLEPDAPPTGTPAVYDRTPGGPTHVVSLLPGDVTPAAGDVSIFHGASTDGTVVVFDTQSTPGEDDPPLYARVNNEETLAVAGAGTIFGGISRQGERIAYLRPNSSEPRRPNPILPSADQFPQGNIFSYDAATETTTPIGTGEKSILVNVSSDGSHVYFDSTKRLNGEGTSGAENLYVWSAATGATRLVAVLTQRDVFGEQTPGVNADMSDGLGLWLSDAATASKSASAGSGADPSRSSSDGSVLIFESRAKLTAYENGGHAEVYRFDESAPAGKRIECLSCNPTGSAAASDASLQTLPPSLLQVLPPVNSMAAVPNLTPDGRRAFFETADPLAARDVDGKVDVYEWEAQGTGNCGRPGGCVGLISSGRSATDNYLYAASASGSDVFFETGDLLVPEDRDATLSIYDARVGGGFPEGAAPPGECLGEACQPAVAAPSDATPASATFHGPGNAKQTQRRCGRHRRLVRRHGKAHCVKRHRRPRHRHHRKHRRAAAERRAGR
jgi:hypothetical protein